MARVSISIENHIAVVTLTRGDKMNAMDFEMITAIVDAGQSLQDSKDVRAVVLTGEGNAFCSGLDVASFAMLAGQDPEALIMPRTHGTTNQFQAVSMVWNDLPIPVIASLHGVAYGAGFQLALGADIRIATPETKLAIMEMKWGLVPDMGGMVLLPPLTRTDVIRRLTYTADPIDAVQGEKWGLVTELSDNPMARAMELATQITHQSPSAIRAAKRLITVAQTQDDAAILMAESREQTDLIGKPDQMEVIAANMAKRKPSY